MARAVARPPVGLGGGDRDPRQDPRLRSRARRVGLNVQRDIPRKNYESLRWRGARRGLGVNSLAYAGVLAGVTGLRKGRGLDLKPFLSYRYEDDGTDVDDEVSPGFDLFWRITPSTTAVLTVNTDFAEADVDARTINLSRFPTFFPRSARSSCRTRASSRSGGSAARRCRSTRGASASTRRTSPST